MANTRRHRGRVLLALASVLTLAAASCGSDDNDNGGAADDTTSGGATTAAPDTAGSTGATDSGKPVTIDWWHIQNNDPGKADWQAMADAYTTAASERHHQDQRARERGLQGGPADQPAGR